MKNFSYIAFIITVVIVFAGCTRRDPGRIYMPDMTYSRAYESYAQRDSTEFTWHPEDRGHKIFYNSAPVNGTLKRGEEFPYPYQHDTLGYKMSATVKNPFADHKFSKAEMTEIGRLYNINCAICHGAKGAADGPLATSGKVGGIANLSLPNYKAMADGTMFHSITYGKNNMGSYASQLTRAQRWKIIRYVRTLQGVGDTTAVQAATDTTAAAPATAAVATPAGN